MELASSRNIPPRCGSVIRRRALTSERPAAMTRTAAPRVYWVRRVMILGTALLLVFGIASTARRWQRRLVGRGGSGAGGGRHDPVGRVGHRTDPSPDHRPDPDRQGEGKHHLKSGPHAHTRPRRRATAKCHGRGGDTQGVPCGRGRDVLMSSSCAR